MEPQEQARWMKLFSEFLEKDYANVKAMGQGWRESFERGLEVLAPMTMCEAFVVKSRQYMDYERRVQRMGFFVEELRKQVVETDGKKLVEMILPEKRKRGRPTKIEQAQMRMQQAERESGKMEALAKVAGMKGVQMGDLFGGETTERATRNEELGMRNEELEVRSKEQQSMKTSQSKDLKNSKDSKDSKDLKVEGEKAVRLQDIKYLLSGDLQTAVDEIAMLRSEAARMSENAKEAVMSGASQDVVAEFARQAAAMEERRATIYDAIDKDLARVYIRARVADELQVGDDDRAAILQKTEYYYKKVVGADPAFEGVYLTQLAADKELANKENAWGMSKQERRKILKGIHDYFMRRDVKPSESRLKKMRDKIEQARALGENVEGYEAMMKKEEEEVRIDN